MVKRRRRSIANRSREEPEMRKATTAELSQRNSICRRNHRCPQKCAGTTRGKRSNTVMLRPAKDASQETEKQQGPQMAPKPKDAAAADETKNRATASYSACEKKLTSAQEIKNSNHHERSW